MASQNFGEQLTLVAGAMKQRASQATTAFDQVRDALDSRTVIGQATGLLMRGHQLNEEAALEVLRRRSRSANVPVREIARQIVDEADKAGLALRPAADC